MLSTTVPVKISGDRNNLEYEIDAMGDCREIYGG